MEFNYLSTTYYLNRNVKNGKSNNITIIHVCHTYCTYRFSFNLKNSNKVVCFFNCNLKYYV